MGFEVWVVKGQGAFFNSQASMLGQTDVSCCPTSFIHSCSIVFEHHRLLPIDSQILEGMAKTGLQPNEYSLIMVLQAANFKSKGRYKVGTQHNISQANIGQCYSSCVDCAVRIGTEGVADHMM